MVTIRERAVHLVNRMVVFIYYWFLSRELDLILHVHCYCLPFLSYIMKPAVMPCEDLLVM